MKDVIGIPPLEFVNLSKQNQLFNLDQIIGKEFDFIICQTINTEVRGIDKFLLLPYPFIIHNYTLFFLFGYFDQDATKVLRYSKNRRWKPPAPFQILFYLYVFLLFFLTLEKTTRISNRLRHAELLFGLI